MNVFEPGDRVKRSKKSATTSETVTEHGIVVEETPHMLWVWPIKPNGDYASSQSAWDLGDARLVERHNQRHTDKPAGEPKSITDPLTPDEEAELKRFMGIEEPVEWDKRYRGNGGDNVLKSGRTVNEARAAKGLAPLRNRDGSDAYGDDLTDAMRYAFSTRNQQRPEKLPRPKSYDLNEHRREQDARSTHGLIPRGQPQQHPQRTETENERAERQAKARYAFIVGKP